MAINQAKLNEIIESYKNNFERIASEEEYKWKAVKTFQDNWNIDSLDFAEMLDRSLKDTDNLLRARNFYPRSKIYLLAQKEPQAVKRLFENLYKEDGAVWQRIQEFQDGVKQLFEKYKEAKNRESQQSLMAITVYLMLKYPDKYYIYKWQKYMDLMKAIDYKGVIVNDGVDNTIKRAKEYFLACEEVLNVVEKDLELQKMNEKRQSLLGGIEDKFHLLVDDIAYFVSASETSLEKYDPKISKEEWLKLLQDPSIFQEDDLYIMKMFLEQNNESTCTNLSKVYGKDILHYNHFNSKCTNLAVRINNITSCDCAIIKGAKSFWPILFQGKEIQEDKQVRFLWKLRLPLQEALKEMDLEKYDTDKYAELYNKSKSLPVSTLPKNIILYGPPGTGKTYNTAHYAVAIIEGKSIEDVQNEDRAAVKERFDKYRAKKIECVTFHQSYGYEEFIEGIRPNLNDTGELKYKTEQGVFKKFCKKALEEPEQEPYVFIIDEINRGNISKIFGELITLVEPSKRLRAADELQVLLPYSKENFGIPDNVYIVGTMNTADRSIALIDTALRRRFAFVEMLPDYKVLKTVEITTSDGQKQELDLGKMLQHMNERIELLYDREHMLGHAYFIELLNKESVTIKDLRDIFANTIVPLLQEYFYEDSEKISFILADANKEDNAKLILEKNFNQEILLAKYEFNCLEKKIFDFNWQALENFAFYQKI